MKTESLFGYHAVFEALRASRRKIQSVELTAAALRRGDERVSQLRQLLEEKRISWKEVSALKRSTEGAGREQAWVRAEAGALPPASLDELVGKKPLPPVVLAADGIQDPQNLGAVLRSFYAFGGEYVLLPERRSCGVTPTVSSASAGAAEHLKVVPVGSLADAAARLKKAGYWIVVSEPAAGQDPSATPGPPLVLVIGNEERGVKERQIRQADASVSIPIRGDFDSLNVSVSAGILFYALRKSFQK